MARSSKVKRNDPCPCGSGKKYKRCCMAGDKAEQAERVAWERATQDMRVALIGFAKEESFVKDLAAGLGLFWQDRYTIETVPSMSVDESLRFFDWFAHDYRLQAGDDQEQARAGKRLIEVYRAEVDDALTEKEASVLDGWIASPPGSAFVLEETDSAEATVTIRDLLLPERTLTVHDAAAAKHGEVGQVLLARPLPERDLMRLSGATAVLPASESDALCSYMDDAWGNYLGENEGADKAQFLRERAYLLTHYALEWADREGRPAVAADDPDQQRPGGKAMQTLVKWQQERVQVR
jgi:hypothetical protein